MRLRRFVDVNIVKRRNETKCELYIGCFKYFISENLYNKLKATNSKNFKAPLEFVIEQTEKEIGIKLEVNKARDKELIAQDIINFFIEFDFEVSTRFINTITTLNSTKDIIDYVLNYFKLSGNRNYTAVKNKLRSAEWGKLADELVEIADTKSQINKRLQVFYGPQGTGKTTDAVKQADEVMVCHSGMLPQDMLEDFKFVDGKPSFDKSTFYEALEQGKTVVLDEFNLLPFETIRFLQSIFDGKKELMYKNRLIKIHNNFKVIATMNLFVNGIEYALPEPIVDRCSVIKEFKPNAKLLASVM